MPGSDSVTPIGLVRGIRLDRERVPDFARYPFAIPAIAGLDELELDPHVTCFVGENGSGKSTLLEAIAVACRFNAEGGTKNFNFATRRSESELHEYLRVVRSHRRTRDGFFLRAESLFNVATEIERVGVGGYGDRSLHEQSHGESFLALMLNRFGGDSLFLLDEPEAALSPMRQLALLSVMKQLVDEGSQFIIATHSPIVLAYPGARIYALDGGLAPIAYDDIEHVRTTRDFLNHRGVFLDRLFAK
ncbi:MAG TPA: AAA family ATPase [Kofleriaceae bacterium]|jgi:predicted ATPase